MTKPVALTIAGSDPSGGAGLQADLKTFHQFGVYGMSVVTLLTIQNTVAVDSVDPLDPDYVELQLQSVTLDIPPQAAKTGALGNAEIVGVVARWAAQGTCPLVVDPVLISKHGAPLMGEEACRALLKELLPQAALVTPNLPEAAALTGREVIGLDDMRSAARQIADLGPKAVLIKGGHLDAGQDAVDLLYVDGAEELFSSQRYDTRHTHGTGCTYSAAITAELAKGTELAAAVKAAKRYISEAIATAPGLGSGSGPVNHHAE
ncbi:MAG: bifunctional hydroxymethylpyrimidine kinase/phosphomethylpyrimidine kinase [Acidobacteria bacterium]|nr:bifunctional hydroxymethylpyrimidine kinase/phosphomethylpyrimidine kinase [Acidobacteriota bacterium]